MCKSSLGHMELLETCLLAVLKSFKKYVLYTLFTGDNYISSSQTMSGQLAHAILINLNIQCLDCSTVPVQYINNKVALLWLHATFSWQSKA